MARAIVVQLKSQTLAAHILGDVVIMPVMTFVLQSDSSLFTIEATLLALFIVIILVALVARLIRLPYTTILVLAGLGLGALGALPRVELTPELVLLLFLPPLAFEAAFHLDFEKLRDDFTAISILALLGVVITVVVVGVVLAWGLGWNLSLALLFGTLIAATDPVSVVAVFRELGIARRLSTIVEGESLFNDGTSIVLFRIALTIVVAGSVNPTESILEFLRLIAGGIALGLGAGFLFARIMRPIDDYLIEISLTVVLAWGTYLVAENQIVHVSGVIAVVVAGLVLGNYGGRVSFSPTTKIVLTHVLEFIAFVANSFIFLLIGLRINLNDLAANLTAILWAIGATLLARAIVVYGLAPPLARLKTAIPLRWQHLLFWGGLRGGLTLALALSLPGDMPLREALIVAAFGVVLFTLVVQGMTIQPLLQLLNLAPAEQIHRKRELTLGRLGATRAAQTWLRRLRDQGALSADTVEVLGSQYGARENQLQDNLRALYPQHADVTEQEIAQARLEGLRAERSALLDLRQRGAISDGVYRELAADIDAQLNDERVSRV